MSPEEIIVEELFNTEPESTPKASNGPTMLVPEIVEVALPEQYDIVLDVLKGYGIQTPEDAIDNYTENGYDPVQDRVDYLRYLEQQSKDLRQFADQALMILDQEIKNGNIGAEDIQNIMKDIEQFRDDMNRLTNTIAHFIDTEDQNKPGSVMTYDHATKRYYGWLHEAQLQYVDASQQIAAALRPVPQA